MAQMMTGSRQGDSVPDDDREQASANALEDNGLGVIRRVVSMFGDQDR